MNTRQIYVSCLLLSGSLSAAAEEAPERHRFDCVIQPSLRINLGSPVQGILEAVHVDRGDFVTEGEVVARLEGRAEAATVALIAARADNDAEIARRETRLRYAEQAHDRVRQLIDRGVSTMQAFEESEATVENAQGDVDEARFNKHLAELELARAREIASQKTIRSPFSGWVMDRFLSAGEYVHQEAPILALARLDPLYVEAFVPVKLYPRFSRGLVGEVRTGEMMDDVHTATVTVTDRVFDTSSGTFRVRLTLPNPDATMPAGQRCEVHFDLEP